MSDYPDTDTMDELPLFAPLARATDPATSREAAERIAPGIKTAAGRMLAAIRAANMMQINPTAGEAAVNCKWAHGGNQETYRKRVGELQRTGLIEVVGSRKCKETGFSSSEYRLTRLARS